MIVFCMIQKTPNIYVMAEPFDMLRYAYDDREENKM